MSETSPRRGLRADGTPAMTAAELRATREHLGLSLPAIADIVQVNERNVRRWDAGENPVPEGIAAGLDAIARDTAAYVAQLAAARAADPSFVVKVPMPAKPKDERVLGEAWGHWPPSWWWAVAGRVLDADRSGRGGLIVYVDAAEHGPSLPPPARPVVPRPAHAQHQRPER